MRTHLMAGTALVAATMLAAGGAAAQDKKMMKPSISVNGYYEGIVGGILDETQETNGVDTARDTSALDTRTDAEIHFNGRATTDNGLKFHARVELEGANNHSQTRGRGSGNFGDPIDEYFLSVSGSFGQIILGGTGGAPVKMLTGMSGSWATGVGETLNFDNEWTPSAANGPGSRHYNVQHSRLDTGDGEKVTYISPKFGGFQVGVSYVPRRANHDDNVRPEAEWEVHDGLEGAVSYSGKFGDVGFAVGAGMTTYQGANKAGDGCTGLDEPNVCSSGANPTDDLSDWLVAARIDFGGGFRVAVAHKQVTNDNKALRSQLTDVGARFVTGANSFSLVGSHGEMDNNDGAHTAVMGSYARAMGPGVKAHVNVLHNKSESQDGTRKNSGTALITGIRVTF